MTYVSAYIPCFNNRKTIASVITSVQKQSFGIEEILVIDDGSTDDSAEIAAKHGVKVVRQAFNLGRGATRLRGMTETRHQLVLCCDATNVLPADFVATAVPWFERSDVAAVCGQCRQRPGGNAVTRWQGRHLFKVDFQRMGPDERTKLATGCAVVRRSAVEEVGNFNPLLRHSEDAELGKRLLAGGWKVVVDPRLIAFSIACNSLAQVMERYWRWYAGADEPISVNGYVRNIWYSMRTMVMEDLAARDFPTAFISLLVPHYQFWRSVLRKILKRTQW
ncbi:MAG: glycosyltransferase [Candidatus Riflebacteria bacterium]|nr:glycosyltransferase [Candidatus Riflebacteria bacterium]